jgi:hypothetical protein
MPQGIVIEQAPEGTDQALAEWLERQLITINNAFGVAGFYEPQYVIPNKPRAGQIYYFPQAIATTPITSEGFWGYLSTGWQKL